MAGLPALTHTFGELGVGTALMLHFHAAHRNLVLDSQTYYPNLTDDVIAGGPLRFDGCFLDVPQGPGLGVDLDPERVAALRGVPRRRGGGPAGAAAATIPTTTATT